MLLHIHKQQAASENREEEKLVLQHAPLRLVFAQRRGVCRCIHAQNLMYFTFKHLSHIPASSILFAAFLGPVQSCNILSTTVNTGVLGVFKHLSSDDNDRRDGKQMSI